MGTLRDQQITDIYLTASDGNLESSYGLQIYENEFNNTMQNDLNGTNMTSMNSTYAHKPKLKLQNLTNALRSLIGPLTSMQCIYVYTFLICICIVSSVIGCILFFVACMKSSQGLHALMFTRILRTPMSFYDNNPSGLIIFKIILIAVNKLCNFSIIIIGRILNRFSKDMGSVDEMLPKDMMEAIQILLFMTSALIMISITNTWLLIPIVCMVLMFLSLLTIYLRSAQDIKRLEGISE